MKTSINFLLEKKFEPIDFQVIPFDFLEVAGGSGGGCETVVHTSSSLGRSGSGLTIPTPSVNTPTYTTTAGTATMSITFNTSGGIQNIQMAP